MSLYKKSPKITPSLMLILKRFWGLHCVKSKAHINKSPFKLNIHTMPNSLENLPNFICLFWAEQFWLQLVSSSTHVQEKWGLPGGDHYYRGTGRCLARRVCSRDYGPNWSSSPRIMFFGIIIKNKFGVRIPPFF
jgi:hypothetical protein